MKLAKNMWVAVFDGAKGLFLQNVGTATEPRMLVRRQFAQDNPSTHEQGRGQPGRVHDMSGLHKSSVAAADLHQRAEDAFVVSIMEELEREAERGGFDQIVLVAPPVAIGAARPQIGPSLRAKIVKEVVADYVKLPVTEIADAVKRILEA